MSKLSKVQMPPKLRYRIRKWIQHMRGQNPTASNQQLAGQIAKKFEEALALKSLKKNQAMGTLYKSGGIRLDFGAAVSDKAKRAALEWAKKKGLQVNVGELAKSANKAKMEIGNCTDECIKRVVWDC